MAIFVARTPGRGGGEPPHSRPAATSEFAPEPGPI